jgi:hypothetical protein
MVWRFKARWPELVPAVCIVAGVAGVAALCATAAGSALAQTGTRQASPCGPPPLSPCEPPKAKQRQKPAEPPGGRSPAAAPSVSPAPKPDDNVPNRTAPCGTGGGLRPCDPQQ